MRAICFDVTVAGYLRARALARVWPAAMLGRLGTASLREVPEPRLPGPEWVELEVLGCGVCGTDLSTFTYSVSTALEPFGSFPAVLGHEVVARVARCSDAVDVVEVGQRVAVDPMISCAMRGFAGNEACGPCRGGHAATCLRSAEEGRTAFTDGPIGPGMMVGYHRDLPGGFAERMVAHQSQLYPVDDIDNRTAALIEPLSIAVHAVLSSPAREDEPVLVIGSGTIALGVVWALRATGFRGEVIAQTKRPHEARLAERLGASGTVKPGAEAREALLATGAAAHKPIVGAEVYAGGGFPLIFDCVGNRASLDQALRFASARGRIVVLGCAARVPDLDLTWLWARELSVRGFMGYGAEQWRGRTSHTFEVTRELLGETGTEVSELVTHTFPLSRFREALRAAGNHRRSGAVKVQVEP